MRAWTFVSACVGAAIAVSACSLPVADKESDAIARAFYDEVRTGADIAADPHLDPSLKTDEVKAEIAGIRALLPPGAPTSIQNVGWHYATSTDVGASAQLAHLNKYANTSVHVQTILAKAPGQTTWTIVGFEAEPDGATAPPIVIGRPPKSASDFD